MNSKTIDFYVITDIGTFHDKKNMAGIIDEITDSKKIDLEVWLNNDLNYNPLTIAVVTKLELSKIGRVKSITIAESK